MTTRRDEVSLGALALILFLALPMGVLSLFAPRTSADEVDAADSVLVGRVSALQSVPESGVTLVQLELDHVVVGRTPEPRFSMQLQGRPALEVGDRALLMVSFDPPAVHGAYPVRKDRHTLEDLVETPVTGLASHGAYEVPGLALPVVEEAIRLRRGVARGARGKGSSKAAPTEGGEDGPSSDDLAGTSDDHGDDIASATPVMVKLPHLMTGMPTATTGFLTPGDVDYFSFFAPELSLLHAETRLPEGVTSLPPDTFMGLFEAGSGELLAFDDDSGQGSFSHFIVPIETTGTHAVAVEGAPDDDLDFSGDEGMETGPYELLLELEEAALLSNFLDLIVGVSPDGTFIEDFVGFKRVGGIDVLREGVEGDGWGLEYDARVPSGLSHVYGGAGDYLVPPGFNAPVERSLFTIGPFGPNRRGRSESITMLPYRTHPRRGVEVGLGYQLKLSQSVVNGNVVIKVATEDRILDIEFRRLLDVDLFGTGPDTFYWSFDPADHGRVYPVEVTDSLDDPVAPAAPTGQVTGDRQVALVGFAGSVAGGTLHAAVVRRFPVAFTLVDQFVNEQDAVQSAAQNLIASGMETWTVAVDVDPSTGLHTAFGVGMGPRID